MSGHADPSVGGEGSGLGEEWPEFTWPWGIAEVVSSRAEVSGAKGRALGASSGGLAWVLLCLGPVIVCFSCANAELSCRSPHSVAHRQGAVAVGTAGAPGHLPTSRLSSLCPQQVSYPQTAAPRCEGFHNMDVEWVVLDRTREPGSDSSLKG